MAAAAAAAAAKVVGKAPSAAVVAALAPTGTLRAAINMSNFLLVTDKTEDGLPIGVSASLAAHVAARLGVPLTLMPYPSPPALCEAAGPGESAWDIGNIGADHAPYTRWSASHQALCSSQPPAPEPAPMPEPMGEFAVMAGCDSGYQVITSVELCEEAKAALVPTLLLEGLSVSV
jgi:ABC-type amino acid transport substrate-binding protein